MLGHLARLRSGRAQAVGDLDTAVIWAREAIARVDDIQSYHEHLARLLGSGEEADAARARAEELCEDDFGTHLQIGSKALIMDGLAVAVRHFEASCAAAPDQQASLVHWLQCLDDLGEVDRLASLAAEVADKVSLAATMSIILRALEAQDRQEEAIALFERAAALKPDDPLLLLALAEAYLRSVDPGRSEKILARTRAIGTRERVAADLARVREDSTYQWDAQAAGPTAGATNGWNRRLH